MKQILFTLTILILTAGFASAQYNKCGPAVPVFSVYYSHEAGTRYGLGIEAGSQGVESPFGLYAGFYLKKLAPQALKSDSSGFTMRGSLYLKGAFRLNQPTGRGSIFLTAAPELSVQTGFDLKSGLRFMLPLSGKKALGLEPLYSVRQRNFSFNLIAAF